MPLKIVKADEAIVAETLVITVFGQPGVGKTSMALSAKNPILFDFDLGIQRAMLAKDSVRPKSWSEVTKFTKEDLEGYDTIIIDTVGRALELCAVEVGNSDAKFKRRTGELTMQGYGSLKISFGQWLSSVRAMGKDVILIGHAKEEKNGDYAQWKLDALGGTKDEIMKLSDLVGFAAMHGETRTLEFNPTESHAGKNCAGFDLLKIPSLQSDGEWFAGLIEKTKGHINSRAAANREAAIQIASFDPRIKAAVDADVINTILMELDHNIAEDLLKRKVHARAKELDLQADKENRCYVDPAKTEDQVDAGAPEQGQAA